jgi:hypothetical protein
MEYVITQSDWLAGLDECGKGLILKKWQRFLCLHHIKTPKCLGACDWRALLYAVRFFTSASVASRDNTTSTNTACAFISLLKCSRTLRGIFIHHTINVYVTLFIQRINVTWLDYIFSLFHSSVALQPFCWALACSSVFIIFLHRR